MSRKDVEIIIAETRRLEALGRILGSLGLNAAEPKRAGRRRMYDTGMRFETGKSVGAGITR
jgi:hypothetical protein